MRTEDSSRCCAMPWWGIVACACRVIHVVPKRCYGLIFLGSSVLKRSSSLLQIKLTNYDSPLEYHSADQSMQHRIVYFFTIAPFGKGFECLVTLRLGDFLLTVLTADNGFPFLACLASSETMKRFCAGLVSTVTCRCLR